MPYALHRPRHPRLPAGRLFRKRRIGALGPAGAAFRKRRRVAVGQRRRSKRKFSDVEGVFVKCKDAAKRRVNRKKLKSYKKFAKKVNNVVYGNLPVKIEINQASFSIGGTANLAGTVGPDCCQWFQFALDPVNNTRADIGLTCHAIKLVGTGATAANPAGKVPLFITAQSNVIPSAAVAPISNPSLGGILTDFSQAAQVAGPSVGLQMWRQGSSYMKFSMKNVAPYGGTLELYTVKPRKRIPAISLNTNVSGNYDTSAGVTFTTPIPTAYTGAANVFITPLEMASYGLARLSAGAFAAQSRFMNNSPMYQLQNSEFNLHFRVVKKCKVYIPAGGFLERSVYHKNGRQVKSDYVVDHLSDTSTTYIVGRWIPECGVVSMADASAQPGMLRQDVTSGSSVLYDLVGVVHYKMQAKQMYVSAPQAYELLRTTAVTGPAAALQATNVHTLMT